MRTPWWSIFGCPRRGLGMARRKLRLSRPWWSVVASVGVGWGVAQGQPVPGDSLPPIPPLPTSPAPALPSPSASAEPTPTVPAPVGNPLPPLLPVPANEPPLAEVPRPPRAGGIEYDPGYQYLPETLPQRPRAADLCGPEGRWWVTPSFELGWMPRATVATDLRLRLTDPAMLWGNVPRPVLPSAGTNSGQFGAGMALAVGRWFGQNNIHGLEGNFYFLNSATTYDAFMPGYVVSFPRSRGTAAAQILPYPPAVSPVVVGTFPFTLDTFFATVDVNYRRNMICTPHARLDLLAGYRYAYLGDELYLGDYSDSYDDYRHNRFAVANHFHGGQIGLVGEVRWEGWYVAGAAKIALGGTTPDLTTTGAFTGTDGRIGNRFRRLGALSQEERTEFAVLPTVNVQLGHRLGEHSRVFVGYSFAYLSHVTRISDATRPGFSPLNANDFWVQSIGFGADFRF